MKYNWIAKKKVDHERVKELLSICEETNQFTNGGNNVKLLEALIKDKFKIDSSKSVICVTNATVAIWILCKALDSTIKWCTQSFTFPSSAQGILDDAIIVDIDKDGGLDLNQVPDECKGIIVTNVFGNIVDINKYVEWCTLHNKYLVFDNAATPYTFYKGSNSCNYGHGSIISFHHTKPLGFGEGGCIIVNKEYEESIRKLINFGFNYNLNETWNRLGGNYKMSELSAVYIIQYLENHFERVKQHHIKMYEKYKTEYTLFPNFGDDNNTMISCLCLLDEKYTNEYINNLQISGVQCRKYYIPLIKSPVAMSLFKNIICYPCNINISEVILL